MILDHESSGHFLNSTLRIKYETVSPTLSLTHRLGSALDFEYAVHGTALAEGNGTDLYLKGVRLKEKAFAGDGVSKLLGLHFFPTSPLRLSVTVDDRHRKFYAAQDTPATYQYPAEFDERTTSGVFKWVGLLHEDGELSATSIQGKRSSDWKDWELDANSATTRRPPSARPCSLGRTRSSGANLRSPSLKPSLRPEPTSTSSAASRWAA